MEKERRQKEKIVLRRYCEEDIEKVAALFYDTVHTVNRKDYTQEQVDAWADGHFDLDAWDESFKKHDTIVAELDGNIVGFADMTADGYLDRLYVHKDFQRRKIASMLCDYLEENCMSAHFTTHASITAKKFFEKRGYHVIKEQQVIRKGIVLINYRMEKSVQKKTARRLQIRLLRKLRFLQPAAASFLKAPRRFSPWHAVMVCGLKNMRL